MKKKPISTYPHTAAYYAAFMLKAMESPNGTPKLMRWQTKEGLGKLA